MGFFKKIGQSIKKNVSLKNVLKIAAPLMSAVPVVGSLAGDMIQNGLDARQAQKDNENLQSEYNKQLLTQTASKVVQPLAQAVTQNFGNAVLEGAYSGVSNGVKSSFAKTGVTLADSVVKQWFLTHWKWLAGAGALILGLIFWRMSGNKQGARRVKR
jgi:hypothetical protein